EQDGARAAVAGVAADLGTGETELVAERVGEAPRRVAGELAHRAVDDHVDDLDRGQVACGHRRAEDASSPSARRRSVRVASIRYAALPRTSSIGASGARSASATSAPRSPSMRAPTRRASSAGRRRAAGAQLPTATPAARTLPSGSASTTTATAVTAIVR